MITENSSNILYRWFLNVLPNKSWDASWFGRSCKNHSFRIITTRLIDVMVVCIEYWFVLWLTFFKISYWEQRYLGCTYKTYMVTRTGQQGQCLEALQSKGGEQYNMMVTLYLCAHQLKIKWIWVDYVSFIQLCLYQDPSPTQTDILLYSCIKDGDVMCIPAAVFY